MKKDKQYYLSKFVFFTLIVSIIFIGVKIYFAPVHIDPTAPYVNVKGDYVLMFTQCILGIVAMILPSKIEHKLKISIPSGMMVLYVLFLYCAIFLGEVRSFYYTVPHWDTLLHAFSGGMCGALGFAFVSYLNKTDKIPMILSPFFVALFAFCFAVTIGVVWEIYEFTFDGLLQLNMQKFMLENGEQLIGRAALYDTMKDLIVDCVGAFIVTFIGYITLKKGNGWVQSLQFLKKKKV